MSSGLCYAEWAARWRVPLHFLVAAVVLLFARPTPELLSAGALAVLTGLAVRAWAAGHLRRDSPLTVSGPYAHLRHPLYLGSGFILTGFAIAGGNIWVAAVLGLYFALLFIPAMRREERERRARAPELYAAYAAHVPALWLCLRPWTSAEGRARFDAQLYLRNREWRAALGCGAALVLLSAKMLWG